MKNYPSLFIVSLHYEAALADVDARMGEHMFFLNAQYKAGRFLLSGRKLPRTGGIIIARAANKKAVERIMKTDPFYKHGLVSFDIIEFSASQHAAVLDQWLKE